MQVNSLNNSLAGYNKSDKKTDKIAMSRDTIMITAMSASGIGRIVAMDVGKDLAKDFAQKKAQKLAKNKEEQLIIMEKYLKKIKLPVTLTSTITGVLIGLLIVLIPAKLYNDSLRRKNNENSSQCQ